MDTRPTGSSTHGERRASGRSQAAVSLLDELDATCKARDVSNGRVGNLRGLLTQAQRNLDTEEANHVRLEAKAARIRRAFDAYMTGDALEDVPEESIFDGASSDAPGVIRAIPEFAEAAQIDAALLAYGHIKAPTSVEDGRPGRR